jgi:hypothetical protein
MPGQGLSLFVIGSAWDSCSRPPIAAVVAPPHSAASDPKNTRTTATGANHQTGRTGELGNASFVMRRSNYVSRLGGTGTFSTLSRSSAFTSREGRTPRSSRCAASHASAV